MLAGGAGTDLAEYAARTVAVTASIDGGANDGASGEGDDIGADVERIRGGSGDDTLSGDANANLLYGGGGNDALAGRGQRHAGGRPRR